MALINKLEAIGDAVRAKTGDTNKLTLDEMATKINGIKTSNLFIKMVDRTITNITAEDLEGITTIGPGAFEYSQLSSIELPDTITTIGNYAFGDCRHLKNLIIPENTLRVSGAAFGSTSIPTIEQIKFLWRKYPRDFENHAPTQFSLPFAKKALVRGSFYDTIMEAPGWAVMKQYTEPFDEYVSDNLSNKICLYNTTIPLTISLQNYTSTPEYTIVSSADSIVSIANIVATAEAITFNIVSHETEGTATITVNINGAEDYVFSRNFNVTVYEKLIKSTYEVVPIDNVPYGFILNSAGYYESQNKHIQNSYALCRVNISNPMGYPIVLECINYGETNYDYGVIGQKDKQLNRDNNPTEANVFFNFKGQSTPNVQRVTYPGLSGDCFIEIKYRKDSSGDQGNDSLQFKIKFDGQED